MSESVTFTIRRRWLRLLAVVATTAAVVAPVAVWASDGFSDVAESDTFHDDIEWLADNGITAGCNPPGNTRFCPRAEVTREQMAAFMRRLASADVVEAASAVTATNAQRLGNRRSPYFQRPIAIASGSGFGTTPNPLTVDDGEAATVSIAHPGAGTIVVRHSESWGIGATFRLGTWVEPRQPAGQRCNSYSDGDALPGTLGVASNGDALFDLAQTVGTGTHAVGGSGSRTYSLCIDTFEGNATPVDWSVSLEWYPAAASVASLAPTGEVVAPDVDPLDPAG